jgi:hypothetical protein
MNPDPNLNPHIINPTGSPMLVFNKENAIALLQGLLAAQTRPAIHFVRNEDVLAPKQIKHNYRFYIANVSEIFNVSGLITAAFGAHVNDRSQTFSVNSLNSEEDLKQFSDAIRRFTGIPNLILVDLLTGATDVLDMVINPNMQCFMPDDNGSMVTQSPRFNIPPILDDQS